MIGEAEVVVGAEVHHTGAVGELDVSGLRRGDDPFVLEQPVVHQAGRALLQVGE